MIPKFAFRTAAASTEFGNNEEDFPKTEAHFVPKAQS